MFFTISFLVASLTSAVTSAENICTQSCRRWGETTDCGSSCPPCRTKSTSDAFRFDCWDYLPYSNTCPLWSGIIDCSSGSPVPDIDLTSNKPVTLTIFNKCSSDYIVYYNGKAVNDQCLNGNYCSDYYGTNPAFYVKKLSDESQLGFTLVELNIPIDRDIWYDISRVTGFNVGARIDYRYTNVTADTVEDDSLIVGHSIVCTDVNCKDAYHLCDIAEANVFSPVYRNPSGGSFAITFCPDETNSEPINPSSIGNPREQDPNTGPFTCDVKVNWEQNPQLYGTIVYGGAIDS